MLHFKALRYHPSLTRQLLLCLLKVEAVTARHSLSEYTAVQRLKSGPCPSRLWTQLVRKLARSPSKKWPWRSGCWKPYCIYLLMRRSNKLSALSLETAHGGWAVSIVRIPANLGLSFSKRMYSTCKRSWTKSVFRNALWIRPGSLWARPEMQNF